METETEVDRSFGFSSHNETTTSELPRNHPQHQQQNNSVEDRNGAAVPSSDTSNFPDFLQHEEHDAPQPTVNGGFTHTLASRAKISAANKGKTPWNKGRRRSEEERARIAAGVRARNRERFLQKLKDLGLTESEYEQQKKAERRARDAERRARRTANGGYRPTEETKRKISQILKRKYANGEVQRKPVDPSKVRRGFTHSAETRAKISESLRKRWANDSKYRAHMVQTSHTANSDASTRQKISTTLREKWKDPEFRESMMKQMAQRRRERNNNGGSVPYQHNEEHRRKISAAMKAKWQDEEYRQKTQAAIAKRRAAMAGSSAAAPIPKKPRPKKARPKAPAVPRQVLPKGSGSAEGSKSTHVQPASPLPPTVLGKRGEVRVLQPLVEPRAPKAKRQRAKKRRTAKKATVVTAAQPRKPKLAPSSSKINNGVATPPAAGLLEKNTDMIDDLLSDIDREKGENAAEPPSKRKSKAADGNVDRMKEERRDLYDLLYGDDQSAESTDAIHRDRSSNDDEPVPHLTPNGINKLASVFNLEDDDNLDTYDPYGLEDF